MHLTDTVDNAPIFSEPEEIEANESFGCRKEEKLKPAENIPG